MAETPNSPPITNSSQRRVKHFECKKGVVRVANLQPKEVENGKKLGTLPCSVGVMLGEKHLEFTVILDTKGISRANKNGSRWFGFYFCGTVNNLEKCFQKKYHNLNTIYSLVETSFARGPSADPYSCPLLVIGDVTGGSEGPGGTGNQAFWQVRNEDQSKVIGFVPLFHRTDVFHTFSDYPLITFERNPLVADSHGTSISICTNIDRNNLLLSSQFANPIELDELYSQSLHKIASTQRPEKWNIQLIKNKSQYDSNEDFLMSSFEQLEAQKPSDWNYVQGVVFSKKTITREADLVALCVSGSGRTHFSQVVQSFYVNPGESKEADKPSLPFYQQKVEAFHNDVKQLQSICSKGVTIYNPFLAKEHGPSPTIISQSSQIPTNNSFRRSFQEEAKLSRKSSNDDIKLLEDTEALSISEPASSLPHLLNLMSSVSSQNSEASVPPQVMQKSNLPQDPSILQSGKVISQPVGVIPPSNLVPATPINPLSILDQIQAQTRQAQPIPPSHLSSHPPLAQLDRHRLAQAVARAFLNMNVPPQQFA